MPLVGTPRLAAAKGWVFTIRSLADSWSAATAATACLDIRVTMPGAGLDVARRNLAHACGRRLNAMSVEGRRTGRQPRSGARIARRNIMDRTVSAATSCRNRNAPKSENARWRLLQGTVNAVSYTHLDVYKRQRQGVSGSAATASSACASGDSNGRLSRKAFAKVLNCSSQAGWPHGCSSASIRSSAAAGLSLIHI